MRLLLRVRNYIEGLYNRHTALVSYVVRLVLMFLCLLAMKNALGFNELLSEWWFVIAFAVMCAFLKIKYLIIAAGLYACLQAMSLSIEVGLALAALLALIYILYLRLEPGMGLAMLLIPLSMAVSMPVAIPLVLGTFAAMPAAVTVAVGSVVYYLLHYLAGAAAVISGYAGSELFTQLNVYVTGIVTYRALLYNTIILVLVFLVVYYAKRINHPRAGDLSVTIGAGVYLVLKLSCEMLFGTITFARLWMVLLGTAAGLVIALVAHNIILPLDFSRVESAEFEDEEYVYYVKAIPKASISREEVRITRINSRKKG